MVLWVVGAIPYGEPTAQCLVTVTAPRMMYQNRGMYYPVRVIEHIKESLLLIEKSSPCIGGSGFTLSCSISCPLPYVRRHITVNKMCLMRH